MGNSSNRQQPEHRAEKTTQGHQKDDLHTR